MAIVRMYTGDDGKSHFQDIDMEFRARDGKPLDELAVVHAESGIRGIKFGPTGSTPLHNAPGRVCVITLSGAVELEVGDGTTRRLGPGDILIAEDTTGEGHATREVGNEPRVSVFVPLTESTQ